MILVLVSNNLGIMWVGIEATTLLTAFLICIPVSPTSLEAMWKYLIMCSVGVAFAFIGTLLVGAAAAPAQLPPSETLLWTRLQACAGLLDPRLLKAGFLFLMVGYGTKAGLAPMHNWLPDAHSQAPAPVSAVFSGILLNAALYCILRYVPILEAATGHSGWSREILTLFGLVSILVASAFILFQHDAKRMLAYSSVEHLGIITLGMGIGGLGTLAALFHMLNHSLTKTVAFFTAGRLGQLYGSNDMTRMTGALRIIPALGRRALRVHAGADRSRALRHFHERVPAAAREPGDRVHSHRGSLPGGNRRGVRGRAPARHERRLGKSLPSRPPRPVRACWTGRSSSFRWRCC